MKYRIGIDLGGTNIAAGLLDEEYRFLAKDSVKTESEKGFDHVTDNMAKLCLKLIRQAGVDKADVTCIGIGSPGNSNPKTGVIVFAGNLGWHDVPLTETVAKKTGIDKVYLGNDADCAALGEFVMGAGRGYASLGMLTIGTGVGGGIVLDNKLFAPADSAGTELGHTTLIYKGESCTCGRKGCLEAYASFTALIRDGNRAADAHPESELAKMRARGERISGKTVFVAAKKGDAVAKQLVDDFIDYIAPGATNIANSFGVPLIVIGGGISKEGDYVADRIHQIVVENMFSGEKYAPAIKMARLGNDAGILGAGALADYQ